MRTSALCCASLALIACGGAPAPASAQPPSAIASAAPSSTAPAGAPAASPSAPGAPVPGGPPSPNVAHLLPTVESTLDGCERYADVADVYGLCLSRGVTMLTSVDDMARVCLAAGPWADACHQNWLDAQPRLGHVLTTEERIVACGPNQDCAFQALDSDPAADVLEQMARCRRYVPKHELDCDGHSMSRWVASRPDAAAVTHLLTDTHHPRDFLGRWIGVAVVCQGTLTCGASEDPVDVACRGVALEVKPIKCPEH